MPPTKRYAPLSTGADYADVSTRTLRRWIAQGRVTGYRAGPRLIRVDLNELDAMLAPIPSASARVSA
jgi:excisionase family DNA binding protein